jgi:hypothetical protein
MYALSYGMADWKYLGPDNALGLPRSFLKPGGEVHVQSHYACETDINECGIHGQSYSLPWIGLEIPAAEEWLWIPSPQCILRN